MEFAIDADQAESLRAHHFADEMRIHGAQPLGNRVQKIHVQTAGSELENVLESRFIDCPEQSRLSGRGHGGAGLPIEQRHFAEEISRLDKPECLLLTAPAGFRDLHGPFADEIKQIPWIALAKK